MKKLLTLACALLACTMTACGGGSSYSKTVLSSDEYTFHAVGGWGEWTATDGNKMTAASVADVAAFSKDVADKLAKKGSQLKYLYVFDGAEIGTKTDSGWTANARVNGEVKEFDGSATLKVIRAVYDKEAETYGSFQWIPNPVTGGAAHVEALSDNVWISPWQEEKDADGFSWADNPVVTSEGGKYKVVIAQYTTPSTAAVAEFGLAAIKA